MINKDALIMKCIVYVRTWKIYLTLLLLIKLFSPLFINITSLFRSFTSIEFDISVLLISQRVVILSFLSSIIPSIMLSFTIHIIIHHLSLLLHVVFLSSLLLVFLGLSIHSLVGSLILHLLVHELLLHLTLGHLSCHHIILHLLLPLVVLSCLSLL